MAILYTVDEEKIFKLAKTQVLQNHFLKNTVSKFKMPQDEYLIIEEREIRRVVLITGQMDTLGSGGIFVEDECVKVICGLVGSYIERIHKIDSRKQRAKIKLDFSELQKL